MVHGEKDNSIQEEAHGQNWLKPLLPLLMSFINAELVALGDGNDSSEKSLDKSRKVTFSSFDFSSVKTPVDMVTASNCQIELSIDALVTILNEVEALVDKGREESVQLGRIGCNAAITKMLIAFNVLASPQGNSTRIALAEVRKLLPHTLKLYLPCL